MNRLFYLILNRLSFIYFYCWFTIKLNNWSNKKTIVFIDIDNTIADTWPSLNARRSRSKNMHEHLSVHEGMRAFVTKYYLSIPNMQVIYLSARKISLFNSTRRWLSKHQFTNHESSLILVSRPKDKLHYLKRAVQNKRSVVYIDDLSYNHEKGAVYFYDNVITQVTEMPIVYFGFHQINAINDDFQKVKGAL